MRADSPAFPQLATTLRGQRFTENDHVIINDVQKQLTNNRKQNGKTESERHTRTEQGFHSVYALASTNAAK